MDESGSALLRVDPARLDHEQRLDLLADLQRLRARVDARLTATLAAVHADPPPRPSRTESHRRQWAREEVAVRLRWSHSTTGQRISDAVRLVAHLPSTLAGVEAGAYSLRHAEVLLHGLRAQLDTLAHRPARLYGASVAEESEREAQYQRDRRRAREVITAVEARVLPRAAEQTVAQFARTVARAVARLDPVDANTRHRQARQSRFLTVDAAPDGMAWLSAFLPAGDAAAITTALDAVADDADGDRYDGSRRREVRRVDALGAICAAVLTGRSTGQPGGRSRPLPTRGGHRPTVQVTVALSTLLGLDQAPGELAGYGAVPAELAREIAFDATGTWRRLLTDDRGRLLDIGRTTYRPPAAVRALISARDDTCTFPGCARPAQYCDADHLTPWAAGGTTDPANLHALCPRHHHARHDAGWKPDRDPATGATTWTSPAGDVVTVPPRLLPPDATWRSLAPPGHRPPRFSRLSWRTDISLRRTPADVASPRHRAALPSRSDRRRAGRADDPPVRRPDMPSASPPSTTAQSPGPDEPPPF